MKPFLAGVGLTCWIAGTFYKSWQFNAAGFVLLLLVFISYMPDDKAPR